jgi:hypothetical protein
MIYFIHNTLVYDEGVLSTEIIIYLDNIHTLRFKIV